MLAPRYADDGRPLLFLSRTQLEAKRSVDRKIDLGIYAFETVPCAVCGGDGFDALAGKDRCGLRTPVVICLVCGLVQTNPRMTAAAYREYYNCEYRLLHDRESTAREAFARERRRGHRIVRFLDHGGFLSGAGSRFAVEVGCGAGGVLAALRGRGFEVQGLDLAVDRLEHGRRRHGLQLEPGSLGEVTLARRPDLVIYSHVLEHVLDIGAELSRLREVLAPGGVIYVEVPGLKSLDHGYQNDFLRYLQNAHCYHFSLTTLTNLMAVNGFELLAGDERVRSVFRVADDPPADWGDDRAAAVESLRLAERRRHDFHPKAAVRVALQRFGLLPLARRVKSWLGR